MGYTLRDFGGRFLTSERVEIEGKTYPGVYAYVEWFVPEDPRPVSLLLIHGGGGQGSEFLRTPDGRPGWVHRFLKEGFPVYLLDRPGHGRCAWNENVLGPKLPAPSYELLYPRFVEPAQHDLWPEAAKHTRWPGDALSGDRFMASQGPMAADLATSQHHIEAIAAKVFAMTGTTAIISHSAGAPCGWAMTAIGAESVAAVIAVEPLGYPGMEHPLGTFDHGLTAAPLAGPADPFARPVAIISGEASWMHDANERAARFVAERGYPVEHIRLEEQGITGNGHMLMSEVNSDEIATFIVAWLNRNLKDAPSPQGDTTTDGIVPALEFKAEKDG